MPDNNLLKKYIIDAKNNVCKERAFCAYLEKALDTYKNADFFEKSSIFTLFRQQERTIVNKKKQRHIKLCEDDIVVATQFFTPEEVSEYLAVNSLYALTGIKIESDYFDNNAIVKPTSKKTIDKIKIIDIASGTGNLLYSAIKNLKKALESVGFSEKEVKKIISENVIGVELDKVASDFSKKNLGEYFGTPIKIYDIFKPSDDACDFFKANLLKSIYKSTQEIDVAGSLVRVDNLEIKKAKKLSDGLKNQALKVEIVKYLNLVEVLNEKYDLVLINPPYISSSDYDLPLKKYIHDEYYENRADLFSAFSQKALEITDEGGLDGIVAPFNWMFLKKFLPMREMILDNHTITHLTKLATFGYRDAVVYLSAFIVSQKRLETLGSYIDLIGDTDTPAALKSACLTGAKNNYQVSQKTFDKLADKNLAFWLSESFILNYGGKKLSDYLEIRQGLATGNNSRFLKRYEQVNKNDIDFTATSIQEFDMGGKKYALYNKGGEFRKWFGNINYVIKFDEKNRKILATVGNHLPSRQYYFKKGITWTLVSSKGVFGARITDNSVFDVGGSCGFAKNEGDLLPILAYLCSKVATAYLNALNPTVNCQVGDLKNLPYIDPDENAKKRIKKLAERCIEISKNDWHDYQEKAVPNDATIKARVEELIKSETELNDVFINLYGLKNELSPIVNKQEITLIYK